MSGNVQPLWIFPIQQQLQQLQQGQQQIIQDVQLLQQDVQLLQQGQQQIIQDVQLLQQDVHLLQQGQQQQGQQNLQLFTIVETRSECRRYNGRLGMNEMLRPMPDLNGNIPLNFPQTFSDVLTLNHTSANALLQAYGLIPERLLIDKRSQIIDYLK
jgi:endonuclease/exonuclease/phosphatase (EEP) superfamily protein YafD